MMLTLHYKRGHVPGQFVFFQSQKKRARVYWVDQLETKTQWVHVVAAEIMCPML